MDATYRLPKEVTITALIDKVSGKKNREDVPNPVIRESTDAIVKMVVTTILGTDFHILEGDVPEVEVGRVLVHDGIGDIVEVGFGVSRLKVGGRVIISSFSSCGHCSNVDNACAATALPQKV